MRLVFCRADGTPVHPDRFTQMFDKHVKDSGLPRIRLHDLRHTHATLALAAGIHPKSERTTRALDCRLHDGRLQPRDPFNGSRGRRDDCQPRPRLESGSWWPLMD